MRTIDYLTGPEAALFLPGVAAGAAIALLGALLSVFVVLKRMAFIGQGVSHAAFGGIGVAVALGLGVAATPPLVGAFCIATALAIAWATGRRSARADEIIGLFLVGAMALGALLVAWRLRSAPGGGNIASWDAILFGSVLMVSWFDAAAAWAVLGATALVLWLTRRTLVFWAFDEHAAEAFGLPVRRLQSVLLVLVALAVVTSMKLAGVVLATALLVAPGAAALRVTDRLSGVFALSALIALTGMGGGLLIAFEADLPPGACVVMLLLVLYALAAALGGLPRGRASGART